VLAIHGQDRWGPFPGWLTVMSLKLGGNGLIAPRVCFDVFKASSLTNIDDFAVAFTGVDILF